MRLRVASPSLQCSQQVLPRSSASSPKPRTSRFASSSYLTKCARRNGTICCRFVVSGTSSSTKLLKSTSFDRPISRGRTMKRACSVDEFFHGDLSEQIHELAREFEVSEDEEDRGENMNATGTCTMSFVGGDEVASNMPFKGSLFPSKLESLEPFMLGIQPDPPEWPEREEIKWASIERRASSVDLPLSLRIIKKKQQQHQEGFGESACCSVKKAFSSMVFIILELQSYALKMRETKSYEDLEGIITGVHKELHASFAWLFQRVFSRTPSLMIHMMILLADFSVYSMDHDAVIQGHSLLGTLSVGTEKVSARGNRNQQLFDSSAMKSFNWKKIGSGKVNPVANGTEGSHSTQYPDSVLSDISRFEDDKVGGKEVELWSLVVDEANSLQSESRGEVIDHEMMQLFVSPVSVEFEPDDYIEYCRTDLLYQMHLSQDPNNSLLLCNYAQFLHLVARDYDRAEKCFEQAIQVEPSDAEALSQYANFLWVARKDMAGAEERYIQAVAAEPENPFHVSKYATFLWSTGGEETCFPLDIS